MTVRTTEIPVSTPVHPEQPALTTWGAIAQSLAIGPIFLVAFFSALFIAPSGPFSVLAMLQACIGALAISWIITLYVRRYGVVGAIYDYIRQMSPSLGLFSVLLYFVGFLALTAGGYTAAGLLTSRFFQHLTGLTSPWWVAGVLLALVVFALCASGIRLTRRVQLIVAGISALPLLFLSIVIIAQGGASGNSPFFIPHGPPEGLFQASLLALTLFVGFENSALLSKKTANPRKSLARVLYGTVLFGALFYFIVLYASGIGFGPQNFEQWKSDPAFIDTLATRYVGSWLAVVIDLVVLLNAVLLLWALTSATARGLSALARHGFLPAPLARTASFSSRPATPFGGYLFILICALIVVAATTLTGVDPFAAFGITATWGMMLIAVLYLILAVGSLFAVGMKWWQWKFLVFALAAPGLGLFGSIVPFPQWPTSLALYGAAATIVLSLVWIIVLQVSHSPLLAEAARPDVWKETHALPELALPPEPVVVSSERMQVAE
jgi:amino acid transporter